MKRWKEIKNPGRMYILKHWILSCFDTNVKADIIKTEIK